MTTARFILLALVTLALGLGIATGWQSLVASSFASSGAAVITSQVGALPAERVGITLLTGVGVLAALLIQRGATAMTGRCIWPLWGILLALLIGENLGIGLRLVTLATVTLPAAVDQAHGGTPVIDLAQADLIAWAAAGMASGGLISFGLLAAMGRMED